MQFVKYMTFNLFVNIPGKKLGSWDLDPNLKFGAGREIGDFGKRNTGFGKRNMGLQEEKWGFWEEK